MRREPRGVGTVTRTATLTRDIIGAGAVAFAPGGHTVAGAPTTGDTIAVWVLPTHADAPTWGPSEPAQRTSIAGEGRSFTVRNRSLPRSRQQACQIAPKTPCQLPP